LGSPEAQSDRFSRINKPPVGLELCRVLDMDFREFHTSSTHSGE
jgi:hypothetical protein